MTNASKIIQVLVLLIIIIEIIWFSCITLFDGGNDGPGDAAIRSETGLPSPFQAEPQGAGTKPTK